MSMVVGRKGVEAWSWSWSFLFWMGTAVLVWNRKLGAMIKDDAGAKIKIA